MRSARKSQLSGNCPCELLDQPFRLSTFGIDLGSQRLVGLWLQVSEGEFLELVLDLAHPEAVGDWRIDVARLLRDQDAPLLRQMFERPHVVQAISELHDDDADVVHHRQKHLAEVFGLPFLARCERHGADLRDPLHHVRNGGAEQFLDSADRGQCVLDHVMQEAGGYRHGVELHVREQICHRQRVDQIGLARMPHLPPVLVGGEHVRPPQQFDISFRGVGPDFFEELLEANHKNRCLIDRWTRCFSIIGSGRPGRKGGLGGGPASFLTWLFWVHYTDAPSLNEGP
jgi:hypothetical protein